MENTYTYSLLKYKHSSVLGESLNVGLLVYFNSTNTLKFIYPKSLCRIKDAYDQVNDRLIKNYLKQIEHKANSFNNLADELLRIEIESDFKSFIDDYIFPSDGSSLQFENRILNFQYNKSNEEIINYLNFIYLFNSGDTKIDKEYQIAKTFYDFVRDRVNENYFFKNYEVKNKSGAIFKFRYAWQNGSLNLVKPLNFDLSEQRHIARKAHENYGLFIDLEPIANEKDFKYDLLVRRPTKRTLFKEYDHSIRLLERANRTRIIEENNIKEYSNDLIDVLSKKSK